VHQIGLPYHWGGVGRSTGDTANELIGFVADPNVSIQESKCFTGGIVAGRRSGKRRVVTSGPLVRPVEKPGIARDLPEVREKPVGHHKVRAGRAKQGEQS
ncbi:MAG TPA: hypothetical protein VN428_05635, partial [Bryobacteraceae bacterium]|nr:hypothetical protein [Bryobacteraceae bacterium]